MIVVMLNQNYLELFTMMVKWAKAMYMVIIENESWEYLIPNSNEYALLRDSLFKVLI